MASSSTVADLLDAVRAEHGPELARVLARCSYLLDEVAVRDQSAPDRPRHQPGRPPALRGRLTHRPPGHVPTASAFSSACTTARVTTSAAAACSAKSSSTIGAGRAQVDSPKIVSPSITVCTGLIARARPSWPIVASRAAPALSSVRSVATTASVVAVPGVGGAGWHGGDRRDRAELAVHLGPQPVRQARGRVDRRADGVEHHERGHRRAAVEHRAGRPHPALPAADDGARSRPDDALGDRPVGRGVVGGRTGRRGRADAERPSATEVEHDGGGHDRHHAAGHREPDARRLEAGHHAVGRGEAVRRAAGEHDGVDALDGRVRAEQVGLAGAGRGAAHVGPRDGALGGHQHHRGAGEPALDPRVADPQACDIGEGVVRSVRHAFILGRARPVGRPDAAT